MISIERIEARLAAKGLNPFSAAKAAALGQDYVRDIIRGKIKEPSASKLRDLAAVLECSPEYLQGITEDTGDAPRNWHAGSKVARLSVEGRVKKGFFGTTAIRHQEYDRVYAVVAYAIDYREWLELVIDAQCYGVFPADAVVHVIEPERYRNGLTQYVVIERLKEGGKLLERTIREMRFGFDGIRLEPGMGEGVPSGASASPGLSWADLTSGNNEFDIKVVGLVIRCYQFFDGGYGEDEVPF